MEEEDFMDIVADSVRKAAPLLIEGLRDSKKGPAIQYIDQDGQEPLPFALPPPPPTSTSSDSSPFNIVGDTQTRTQYEAEHNKENIPMDTTEDKKKILKAR